MKNEAERNPSQELLVITTQVARLCQVSAETFDPHIHVADAQEIVTVLDPILEPPSKRRSNAYAIGNLTVKKLKKKYYQITLEQTANDNLQEMPSIQIEYQPTPLRLELVRISLMIPTSRQKQLRGTIINRIAYQRNTLWKK